MKSKFRIHLRFKDIINLNKQDVAVGIYNGMPKYVMYYGVNGAVKIDAARFPLAFVTDVLTRLPLTRVGDNYATDEEIESSTLYPVLSDMEISHLRTKFNTAY